MPNGRSVIILGSTSAIARAVAIEFGRQGYRIVLAARDQEENEIIATDLRVRCSVEALAIPFDAEDYASHPAFFDACRDRLGYLADGVVLCFGYMEPQAAAQADFEVAQRTVNVNYLAAISILEIFAKHFEERRSGFIAAISSVAGDRGRQSNYIYGSAKAGLTAYLQGLRNRLFHAGVHVVTIKPGPVDTRMTFGKPPLPFMTTADAVGKAVFNAIRKRKNVAYVPWIWRYIMLIMCHVPEWLFKRTKQ